MIAIGLFGTLCTAGVAFYVCFLVGLCRECKPRRICYLIRLHPEADRQIEHASHELETSITRAA